MKRVTLKYCLNVLENDVPDEKFKDLISLKEEAHRLRMDDNERDEDMEITEEDFFETLQKFQSKKSVMYQFLLNTGLKFKMAIFNLCKRFISSEEFPSSFNVTTLVQLPKKGSQIFLDNSRFLHNC